MTGSRATSAYASSFPATIRPFSDGIVISASSYREKCRAYAKIVQLYESRTNRSSAAVAAFLSPHFRFQDLTQYQE
jgi:hypothetical protein